LTLEEASDALGKSVATVSRSLLGGEECGGWVLRRADRVYAVYVSGGWRVAMENGRGNGWIEYGRPEVRFGRRDVEKIREITLGWYGF